VTVNTVFRLVIIMLLWATCFPFINVGLTQSPHVTFAALRALFAGVSLAVLTFVLQRSWPREGRTWALLAVTGFGSTTLGFLGMFHAAEFVAPGIATVIASIQPLLAAVLSRIFLAERLAGLGYLGLVFGFSGIVIISSLNLVVTDSGVSLVGLSYLLLAAFGVAIGNVAMKKLANNVDGLIAMAAQLSIGAVPLLIFALLLEDVASVSWSPTFAMSLFVLAIPGTALVFWLWFGTLRKVSLSTANAFTFLIPLFALLIGISWFGEHFGWLEAVGSALVLFGIILVHYAANKRLAQT